MGIIESAKDKVYVSFNRELFKKASDTRTCRQRVHLLFTPEYQNFGDQAIAKSARLLLSSSNLPDDVEILEEPNAFCLRFPEILQKLISPNDLLVFTGGGYMGDLWPELQTVVEDLLRRFPYNPVIVLPQTIFYSVEHRGKASSFGELLKSRDRLLVCLREKQSCGISAELLGLQDYQYMHVPDCVLYLRNNNITHKGKGMGVCLRDDREKSSIITTSDCKSIAASLNMHCKTISTIGNMGIPKPITQRDKMVKKAFVPFANSELVITDRLHGMIFAAINATPCIAFDNVSKKVSGVYDSWLKNLPYVCIASTVEEAKSLASGLRSYPLELCDQSLSKLQDDLHSEQFMHLCKSIKAFASANNLA